MGVNPSIDWANSPHYQLANRLAHLYLLRVLNDLPAYLVLVYFLNAEEMNGPATVSEWEVAISHEMRALGIPRGHRLTSFIINAFVDIKDIPRR